MASLTDFVKPKAAFKKGPFTLRKKRKVTGAVAPIAKKVKVASLDPAKAGKSMSEMVEE